MTEKLYYTDAYIKEFSAAVLSCTEKDGLYYTELNKTAFFPEGGGQTSDTGFIGETKITGVTEENGNVFHISKEPLTVGCEYYCKIDWEKRFLKMQNHSGEHIVSGIVHTLYGFNNVGFHLGEDEVTVDFDGELTREQLDEVEFEVNRVIYENVPFKCWFASEDEIKNLDYRSKLDLTENVRLVKIGEDVDLCACCAPHVNKSGEIGVVKILDFFRHRGGVRLFLKCGALALCDYKEKYNSVREISNLLSLKQHEVSDGVNRLYGELDKVRKEAYDFKISVVKSDVINYKDRKDVALIFSGIYNNDMQREFVNECYENGTVISAAFTGDDESGYSYTVLSKVIDMKIFSKEMNTALNGRGGGRDGMIMGKVSASEKDIKEFFKGYIQEG